MAKIVSQPTVLIISDDRKFAPALIARWQQEHLVPDFVSMTTERPRGEATATYNLAVVGPVAPARLESTIEKLARASRPVVVVYRDPFAPVAVRNSQPPNAWCIRQQGDWASRVATRGVEELGGVPVHSEREPRRGKDQEAVLGRCVLEMRHDLNNALTSMLGNAELLLADPARLPETAREQITTIHEMALRIHEMFRRMATLETELRIGSEGTAGQANNRSF